jgi:hypothetical protein
MSATQKLIARLLVLLAFACGAIGLVAGLTEHAWKLGAIGWFTGGGLLALIGLFVLGDGAIGLLKGKQ